MRAINLEGSTMAIYGMNPLGNNYGYGQGGFGGGGSLSQLQNEADAATSRAQASGSPEDAQAAKKATNKMSEAAQAEATKESARNQAVMALLR
jgi:hypothetical protein